MQIEASLNINVLEKTLKNKPISQNFSGDLRIWLELTNFIEYPIVHVHF